MSRHGALRSAAQRRRNEAASNEAFEAFYQRQEIVPKDGTAKGLAQQTSWVDRQRSAIRELAHRKRSQENSHRELASKQLAL